MNWAQIPVGDIQENCYILHNDKKEAIIFDPGDEVDKIKAYISGHQLKPIAILLTHAHFDHIGALDAVRDEWDIPAYLHESEADWLGDPEKNGSAAFPMVGLYRMKPAEQTLTGESTLKVGSFTFQVFETPGHSPGSVSYYLEEGDVVFSGDALFYGSIGRTDLYGGDYALLIKSIKEKLLTLPDETTVAPGHGFETTIQGEKASNPFL